MRGDGIEADERAAAAARSLDRIAATLGVDAGAFFEPCGDGAARSPGEQDAALLAAFGRIADRRVRERLLAAVEREADAADVARGRPRAS